MTNMGLPAERVVMAAMGSNSAKTPEVPVDQPRNLAKSVTVE